MADFQKSQGDLLKQASQIWSMLDDMAESNPSAYKKFIDKQMKEAKEASRPPQPHMCLQTTLRVSDHTFRLFVNVFEWHRVPAPENEEAPISILAGQLYQDKDEEGLHKVISVAFNTKVLQDFGLQSKLDAERQMLINLAIDYLRDVQNLSVSRSYSILNEGCICKGDVVKARQCLSRRFESSDEKVESDLEELQRSFGPLASQSKGSLLNELRNISVKTDDQANIPSPAPVILTRSESAKGKESVKSKLIQDLDFQDKPQTPKHTLDLKSAEIESKKPRRIVIRISLLGVTSVTQCALDISQKDLRLKVDDMYHLALEFPEPINESEAHAKFSRKSSSLTLTLPTLKTGVQS